MNMTGENKLEFLDKIVVRHASSSFETNFDDPSFFEQLVKNAHYLEALLVASPLVHNLLQEWATGRLTDPKKVQKLKETLLNYYIRLYSNPTPFGYFASVGTIGWAEGMESCATIGKVRPDVKLDNELIHALVSYLNALPFIKTNLLYKPNNTVYKQGNQIRYVEQYFSNTQILYKISGVDKMEIIDDILHLAKPGRTIGEIASGIFENENYDFSIADITNFINELINEQLLISVLQVNATGGQSFNVILDHIRNLAIAENADYLELKSRLLEIEDILMLINDQKIDIPTCFASVSMALDRLGVAYDPKKILQFDLFSSFSRSCISKELQENLADAVKIISLMPQATARARLDEFKKKFIAKYEDTAIPVMEAIDTESGISFGEFKYQSDNIFLEDAYIAPVVRSQFAQITPQENFKKFIYKKYVESYVQNAYTINLTERDAAKFDHQLGSLAPTIQVIFSLLNAKDHLVSIATCGNASAGKLIARFGSGSPEIRSLLKEITVFEQDFYKDTIVAEIVHIPEHRIGNVSFRPFIRDYEIPIMTQSLLNDEFQIPLSDLYVAIRNGLVVIFSKKHNIRIIPKLTNAHNYNKKTSPVYQFLSELEYQEIIPSLAFDMTDMDFFTPFIPRVQYKNVIISPATWVFERLHLKEFFSSAENAYPDVIQQFIQKWNLPERTDYYVHGAITLVEWSSVNSVKHFLKYALGERIRTVTLREFCFDPQYSFIKDAQGNSYYNQCIGLVLNKIAKYRPINQQLIKKDAAGIKKKFIPGDEWIYYKLYGGVNSCDKFLQHDLLIILKKLYADQAINKFFFIRYNDPEYHIRIRMLARDSNIGTLISFLNAQFKELYEKEIFWKVQLDTYDRELERYGPKTIEMAESIFETDSLYWLSFMNIIKNDVTYILPIFFARSVIVILDGLQLDLDQRLSIFQMLRNSYESEFAVKQQVHLRNVINKKEKDLRASVEKVLNDDFSELEEYIDVIELPKLLSEFEGKVKRIYKNNIDRLDLADIIQMVPSLIHMHAIRCFAIKPRENELFAYNILWSYHKKLTNKKLVTV